MELHFHSGPALKKFVTMHGHMDVKFFELIWLGVGGGVVVSGLRYKPAGHGFDSRWCHWNFSVT
jgi:hypothetical protein